MTAEEAFARQVADEARCKTCLHDACGICAGCRHGSHYERRYTVLDKIRDKRLDNYR